MGQPVGRQQFGGRSTGGLLTFHYEEQENGRQMVAYKAAILPNPERRPALIVLVNVLADTRGLLISVPFQVCLPEPPSPSPSSSPPPPTPLPPPPPSPPPPPLP